jgi:hypothetical protein
VAFSFLLPKQLRKAGWKLKIRDKENRESPHVTILRGTSVWRVNLRTLTFMDRQPDPSGIPNNLKRLISANHKQLCDEWDRRYPTNPVVEQETEATDEDD